MDESQRSTWYSMVAISCTACASGAGPKGANGGANGAAGAGAAGTKGGGTCAANMEGPGTQDMESI